jgi:hypothetical protein
LTGAHFASVRSIFRSPNAALDVRSAYFCDLFV